MTDKSMNIDPDFFEHNILQDINYLSVPDALA